MAKKSTCGAEHEALEAIDPADSIVWVCALKPHEENVHQTEDGAIWSDIVTIDGSTTPPEQPSEES